MADHLANFTLRRKASWSGCSVTAAGKKWELCTDGGFARAEGAAAWALFAFSVTEWELCASGGIYMATCNSASQAEAIAIEAGLEGLRQFLPTSNILN